MFLQYKRTQQSNSEESCVYRIGRGGIFYESPEFNMTAVSAIAVCLMLFVLQAKYGILGQEEEEFLGLIKQYYHTNDEEHFESIVKYVSTTIGQNADIRIAVKKTLDAFSDTQIVDNVDRSQKLEPSLIVIHDQHGGFRDLDPEKTLQPFLDNNKYFAKDHEESVNNEKKVGMIVWKMSTPLAQGRLWKYISNNYSTRTIVVTSTESLRHEGVDIRDTDSFEQSSYRLLSNLKYTGKFADLAKCGHLIVGFSFGAFHYGKYKDKGKLSVHFHPNPMNQFMSEQIALGRMVGYASVLVGCIVKAISWNQGSWQNGAEKLGMPAFGTSKLAKSRVCWFDQIENRLFYGIRLGVVLAENLFRSGYADEPVKPATCPDPYQKIFEKWFELKPEQKTDSKYVVTSIALPEDLTELFEKWNRVDYYTAAYRHAEVAAQEIVVHGLKNVIRNGEVVYAGVEKEWAPPVKIELPYRVFGRIKTVDRSEIDAFSAIQSLMAKYRDQIEWIRPLSIAVFGPPGSGKSYTIQEILKSVDKTAAGHRVDFNVAQFTCLKDLVVAFHHVQDRALKQEIPLVVFDEFDTPCNGQELGWLHYFLSPMQDGVFKAGESDYKIGRAIFVFSGGTSHSFHEFYDKRKDDPDFRRAKGPDFVSRLHGHLNILGIDSGGMVSPLLMFRRAILLRALLERNLSIIIDRDSGAAGIDKNVIRAFLRIPAYKHGLRSMEAIIQMATISQARRRFQVASVPVKSQLDMHVDAEQFLNWLSGRFPID